MKILDSKCTNLLLISDFQEAALRTFHISDETKNYYLTEAVEQGEWGMNLNMIETFSQCLYGVGNSHSEVSLCSQVLLLTWFNITRYSIQHYK